MKFTFTLSNGFGTINIQEPIGWQDLTLNLLRDTESHGVFPSYSFNKLKFLGAGADFILQNVQDFGHEIDLILGVSIDCDQNGTDEQSLSFKLNLADYTQEGTCIISVSLEENSNLKQFLARKDAPINLYASKTLDGQPANSYLKANTEVTINSKTVVTQSRWVDTIPNPAIGYENYAAGFVIQNIAAGSGFYDWADDMAAAISYAQNTLTEIQNTNNPTNTIFDIITNVVPHVELAQDGTYFVEVGAFSLYNIRITADANNIINRDTNGNVAVEINLVCGATLVNLYNTNANYSITIVSGNPQIVLDVFNVNIAAYSSFFVLAALETIKLEIKFISDTHWDKPTLGNYDAKIICEYTLTPDANAYLSVKQTSNTEDTKSKVFLINEAFALAIESITNNKWTILSDFFGRNFPAPSQPYTSTNGISGCGHNLSLCNGFMLRNFPNPTNSPADTNAKAFNTTFKELFNSMSCIFALGYAIEPAPDSSFENVVRIEPIQYFYDRNTTIFYASLDPNNEDSKFTISLDTELYASELNIGYNKWENEKLNNLDEFNAKRVYRTLVKKFNRKLDKICGFIASGYSIEFTRNEKYATGSTKDYKNDNEVFIVCLEQSTLAKTEQGTFHDATTANLIDPPTVLNWRIAPAAMAKNWLTRFISTACLAPYHAPSTKYLLFSSGEGNYNAHYTTDTPEFCTSSINGVDIKTWAQDNPNSPFDLEHLDQEANTQCPFSPYIARFEYPLSLSQYLNILSSPRGKIEVVLDGATSVFGYIKDIKYKIAQQMASFELRLIHNNSEY